MEFTHANEAQVGKIGHAVVITLGEFSNPFKVSCKVERDLQETVFN